MHELSIATALMDEIVEIAQQHQLDAVDEIVIECGVLRQVVPEFLRTAFQAVQTGTIAAKATLIITEVKPLAQCQRCHHRFEPEIGNFLCPGCELADVEILQGNAIVLTSISGEQER